MARVLVLGGAGQVGAALRQAKPPPGWEIIAPPREALDLARPEAIAGALAALAPALIINAAAYTAVDKAEAEPDAAFAINRDGPARLAREAAARAMALVHISTDYVFDGAAPRPYREDDARAPLGVYGRSKAQGEDAVLEAHPRAAIVRASWVFSAHRANFVKTMLRLGETRDEIGVVADQVGRPTAAADLAAICLMLGTRLLEGGEGGVFHFANAGEASWADFAEAIFAGAAARGQRPVRVKRIATAAYPTAAQRPANSRLDTAKIEAALGLAPRPWRAALEDCLDDLLAQNGEANSLKGGH